MGTPQLVISIIEKEITKNLALMQKGIDTRNTNNPKVAFITKEDFDVPFGPKPIRSFGGFWN